MFAILLTEKQEFEKKICETFIENAKQELGTSHTFNFLGCSKSDPPDCWFSHKGLKVGVELLGLHTPHYKKRFKFCSELAIELNRMDVQPVVISPTLETENLKLYSVSKAACKISDFLKSNPDAIINIESLIENFSQFDPDLARQIHLQKPHLDATKTIAMNLYGYSMDEQLSFYTKNLDKKLEDIKLGRYEPKPDRIIILLHFQGTSEDGSFSSTEWETLLLYFRDYLKKIDSDKLIYRMYISSSQEFDLFGHKVKVARVD